MNDADRFGPVALIKGVLKCTDQEARAVQDRLAAPLSDPMTRAFLARALHLSTTTRATKAARDEVLINEGKRQFGLFMVACAKAGMNLDIYHQPNGE